jgi:hypothetical protein
MQVQNPVQEVSYQAPNRTSTKIPGWFMTVAIGSCLYIKVSPTQWAKPSCAGDFGNVLAGRSLALGYLSVISDFAHFQRHGSTYTSTIRTHNIPSVMMPVFGVHTEPQSTESSGTLFHAPVLEIRPSGAYVASLTMKTSVVVRSGYVVSEQLSIAGPDGYSGTQPLIYSRFGSSPAVKAPLGSQ